MKNVDDNKNNNFKKRDPYPINENLLQSYRRIFISTESFLLAVGVLAWKDNNTWFFITIVIINLLIIIFGWWPIVNSRAKIVDFYKFEIEEITNCKLNDYLKDKNKRKNANKASGKKGPWRLTRIKLDGILPSLFIIIWLMLFFSYKTDSINNNTVLDIIICCFK